MKKRKLPTNILVYLLFAFSFLIIYQISILYNLDVFGETLTGGGWLPYGMKIVWIFFNWATVSIIIAVILWRIKRLNVKIIPLLLIAIILPATVYNINHYIFIYGHYKEKISIVTELKEREKHFQNHTENSENLKKYSIFLTEQYNKDFYTYLYINEELEDMYLFMKLSPDSKTSGNDLFICHQITRPHEEHLGNNKGLNHDECKVISINNYGIRDIEIYNKYAILTKEDHTKIYFICSDFKWLYNRFYI